MAGQLSGKWWRFNRYIAGSVGQLVPASGEKVIEYDPWEAFWEWRGDWRDKRPPYISLLDLLHDSALAKPVTFHNLIDATLGKEKPLQKMVQSGFFDAILEWCAEYGVLGILPHRVRILEYALKGNEKVKLIQQRVGGTWESLLISDDVIRLVDVGNELKARLPEGDWDCIGVESINFLDLSTQIEWTRNEGDLVDRFIAEESRAAWKSGVYPAPLSPWFWNIYGEPILEFYNGAKLLYDCLMTILTDGPDSTAKSLAARKLNILAEPVTHMATINSTGSLCCHLAAPSLLSTYAAMILMDLAEPNRLLSCTECGRIFASGTSRAAYCSSTCRNRYNRRLFRQRQKETNSP